MSHRNTPLYAALFIAVVFLALHLAALNLYFYWTIWWYDVLMHFVAGVVGGLAAYWVLFRSHVRLRRIASLKTALWSACLAMLIVGVGWEVFEYKNGLSDSQEGYVLDTMNDLILDVSGAALVVLLVHKPTRHG